ncbi:30-kDa cleavage and polyadenylation specificity factor 30 [Beauveria bassiana]|nr:30-kDa cleavage and polyadenylation specificity factor 30 [Beauveria bassiana]
MKVEAHLEDRHTEQTDLFETQHRLQNLVRGPPRKPHQSGHAIWVGNLPPQTELMKLVHHVCELAPGLQSLFLISKSNCAFANFKEDAASVEAQKTIHESKFQTVRLVCRLRKSTPEAAAESPIVIADGTSNPESPTLSKDPLKENKSPKPETLDHPEPMDVRGDSRNALANAQRDRFFILKSLTHEDLVQSVKTSVWATQSHNEHLLNNAFKIEESETEGDIEDDNEVMSNKGADDADEDLQTRGKPFNLHWLSTIPLPFYRTRGLRNPWNSNREVKIARDGTELEPSIGRRLVGLMNINLNPGQPPHPLNDPRGFNAFIASGRRP